MEKKNRDRVVQNISEGFQVFDLHEALLLSDDTAKSTPITPGSALFSEMGEDSEDTTSDVEGMAVNMQQIRRDRSAMMAYSAVKTNTNEQGTFSEKRFHEIQAAPIFSARVQDTIESDTAITKELGSEVFSQYSMLGNKVGTLHKGKMEQEKDTTNPDNLIFLNMNEPFSTFICGSQGGGKSHTLSCILEGGLLYNNPVGQVTAPSAGIVFHYDQFSGYSSTQVCEAAYLCSKGIPVRVVVSPTNYARMNQVYTNLEGLTDGMPKPKVIPFHLKEEHLNIQNMKTLMSCSGGETAMPLYLEVRIPCIVVDFELTNCSVCSIS